MKEREKILIVDDMELNREILALPLKEQYDILMAENGAVARKILKMEGGKVSLILLDLVMPIMDGFEFLKYIQFDKKFVDIPIILVTSEASEENVLEGVKMGVRDVLVKPFDPYLVRTRVGNLIALTQSRQEKQQEESGEEKPRALMKSRREPDAALIVDDMGINRVILREALEPEYRVLEAENGEEALEKWKQEEDGIAVVLLDILMPVMDGLQVMREARRLKLLENTPVIAITSEDSVTKLERMRDAGICEVIHKPYSPVVVKNRVDYMVELYRSRREKK